MADTRWLRIKTLFDQAAGLSGAARAAFVHAACRAQPELADEVLSLLEHHESGDEFLQPPDARHLLHAFEQAEVQPRIGRRVGAYRLTRLIASGGMGHVYLGERADRQFERQVAIKVIRRSLDSLEMRRRFHTERRVLAGLNQPHIARLLDGGVTEDGLSYLVMELVEGLPIDEYCRVNGLGLRERLELFRTVCLAAHYAHQRLVVHRDIKPENVVVTAEGTPKLLDFGVAKLVDAEAPEHDGACHSVPFFTPQYASPEQIRGEPITTACDIYALGVLLHQLLTERLPYDAAADSPHALAQAICTQPPIPPSRLPPSAGCPWLRRCVGDLDTIVCTALRKEPERRYASAEQFSEDIRRYLAGLPIAARKDTFTYRARKFVARNKLGVASATALCAAIISVLVGTSVALVRVNQARQRAHLMNQFLQSTLAQMDVEEVGRDLTLRDVLDRASARTEAEFAAYPDVLAGIHSMLGRAYLSQRDLSAAHGHLNRALEIDRGLYGEDARTGAALHDLAVYYHHAGDDRRAAELCRHALALRRGEIGDDAQTAAIVADLAVMLKSLGDYAEAERLCREALAVRRRLLPAKHVDNASSLNNLGVLLKAQGRLAEAQPVLEEALEILRAAHGNEHIEVANALGNLANVLHSLGELPAAESALRDALRINRRLLPSGHPRIAITANNLAKLLECRGDFAEAELLYREAIAINRAHFGAEHPRTAAMLHNLAMWQARLGRYADALTACLEALQARRDALGSEHEQVAVGLDGLGYIRLRTGDLTGAEQALAEAYAIRSRVLPPDHPDQINSLEHLADLHLRQAALDQAQIFAIQAAELAGRVLGSRHVLTARCESLLAEIEVELGLLVSAHVRLSDCLETQRAQLRPAHPDLADTLGRLARCHLRMGDCDQAQAYGAQAQAIRAQYLPGDISRDIAWNGPGCP